MKRLLIILTIIVLLPGVNAIWQADNVINNGLPDVGLYSATTVFHKDGTWYLIAGENAGTFPAFNWTGTAWQADEGINASLPGVGSLSSPNVFYKDGTWYLISGETGGTFPAFNWTGTVWQADHAINASLPDVGNRASPNVFHKDGTWYLIAGEGGGTFPAFNYTGAVWQEDHAINASLPDAGDDTAPYIFFKDGTWYLIAGEFEGNLDAFNWTGTAWQSDSAMASGLIIAGGYSTPSVFFKGGPLYLVSGEFDGTFLGFIWAPAVNITLNSPEDGITTTNDTAITLNITTTVEGNIQWYNGSDILTTSETPVNSSLLVGAWHMNEGNGNSWIVDSRNITDYSGNGNDGVIYGAEFVQGRYEKGLEFDGVDDYVNISTFIPDVDIGDTNPFTISLWVYPMVSGLIEQYFSSSGNDKRFFVGKNPSDEIYIGFGNNHNFGSSTALLTLNSWNHVVVISNGTVHTSFINGVQYDTLTTNGDFSEYNILIGASNNEGVTVQYCNCSLDEVRIYNRSLSASEILEDYNKRLGLYTLPGGEASYTWGAQVSDSYTNSSRATRTLTIDYTDVDLYDETTGTFINSSNSLPINFMNGTSFNIHETINGNNVTFKNIDAFIGNPVRVEARNTTHSLYPYPRSVVSSTYEAGEDFVIYLPPDTENVVGPTLILYDLTDDFPTLTTVLRLKRYIGGELITIFEDFFDLESDASPYLIVDVRYQVSVDNGVEEREMGHYVPEATEDVAIYTGPIQYSPGDNINNVIQWNITEGSVDVNYNDASGNTTALSIVIFNQSNLSQVLVNCTSVDTSTVTCTYNPTDNMSLYIEVNATTGYGDLILSKLYDYFSGPTKKIDIGLLESWHYDLISLFLVVFVFLVFNEVNSGIGALVGVGFLGLLRFLGWVSIGAGIMSILVLFAFFAFMNREKRQ